MFRPYYMLPNRMLLIVACGPSELFQVEVESLRPPCIARDPATWNGIERSTNIETKTKFTRGHVEAMWHRR